LFRAPALFAMAAALCAVAAADVSGTKTLTANTALNLDTGNTAASGGDLLWNGTALAPQGTAGVFNFLTSGSIGASLFANIVQSTLSAVAVANYSNKAVGDTVGAVYGVHTNGGNFAKVLVTSNGSGSVGLQFVTFTLSSGGTQPGGTGPGAGPAPAITAVENAATNIPPGVPNAPIAQGAMFVVKGANLGPASVVIATSFPLTTSIGGTSIKVTVNGVTVDAILYYSLAAQVAAILPSKTPTGTGTLTLTYNGQTASAPIVVTQSNIGIFTVSQSGAGDAIVFLNSDNGLVTPTHAVNSGDVVIFWGTGLGPVATDETQPAVQTDQTNVPLQVSIGGKPATVLFRGRSSCCSSIDIVAVTIPDGLSGCAVSVNMQIGNMISNTTTIATASTGRTCTPVSSSNPGGITGTAVYRYGGIVLERIAETTSVAGSTFVSKSDTATGIFEKITPTSTGSPSGSQIDVNSYGSCTVAFQTGNPANTGTTSGTVQYLDAGPSIAMTAPFGNRSLAKTSPGAGVLLYSATLDQTATTLAAGQYTFVGPGGPDVGPFTAAYTMPAPFVWTNQSSTTTVNRANGLPITWTGGDPTGYVTIAGTSTALGTTVATTTSVAFTCTARVSDGGFTVPSVVLLALPPSAAAPGSAIVVPGTLAVTNVGGATAFTPPSGIDFASVISVFVYGGTVTYQ
jgi:uncharacterized protein (TIGR03437 family)